MTPPEVSVVRGEPDDVELAALVAGLAVGLAPGPAPAEEKGEGPDVARARWRRAARPGTVHGAVTPGPDAWRWSLR